MKWVNPFKAFESHSVSKPPAEQGKILILTPVKDAASYLFGYWRLLYRLSYPHHLISIGFLESDSRDNTFGLLRQKLPALRKEFHRVGLWKKDFGYRLSPGMDRHTESIQIERRSILAKSRNHLLFNALEDEDWVLWIDVDLVEFPSDIIQRLLATGKEIVQPHCVLEYGGPTYDQNAWLDQGKFHLDAFRGRPELVSLDAVGGTMLLVKADIHREGLVFPSFLYGRENAKIRAGRGEIETEGLGIMARDMGYECWGIPDLEIRHRSI